jgi:DNA polymerase-1
VPLHRKTRQPTVDEDALEKLALKHPSDPILPLVLQARGLQKAISYLDTTFVWTDERFHPNYSLAETGRILASKPNIANQPRGRRASEREMARAVRSSVVPSKGFALLEADWRAIEALLVGYFAGDADYMRASRLGVHAILASHILKRPISMSWSDSDIQAASGELKRSEPFLYDASKVVVHSTGYGASAFSVAHTVGCSVPDARKYQAIYDEMAPRVAKWREATRQRAHKEHRLINPFGFVSPYYFDVFSWDKDARDWRLGSQANEVLAFLPQSTGASMLSEVLLILDEEYGEAEDFGLLAPIHDSVLAEAVSSVLDKWAGALRDVMQRPFQELGGLTCEVEVKVGRESWATMVPWKEAA